MGTQAVSKQVSIQDFVLELRKFPEPAFDRTDQIVKFLENVRWSRRIPWLPT